MNKIVLVFTVLFISICSCKKESIADYLSYDKDTINNPYSGSNPPAPTVFDVNVIFDKTWTGYSANDASVKYTMIFDRDNNLHITSEKNGVKSSEVCTWYYNTPDVFVMYPTVMINNQNVKGTWTIKGNADVLNLSRFNGAIELRH